jgi:glutathionylspermidine synthase
VDQYDLLIPHIFKLYPWEGMLLEDGSPITHDLARYVPHVILQEELEIRG